MINKKCSICDKRFWCYVNGKPVCLKHYVGKYIKEDYKKGNKCLEVDLDEMIECLKNRKLDKNELAFLKEIKIQIPEIVEEFSFLFEKLK